MGKERTIVVGGGGFGREVFLWARDCHQAGLLPPISGMIDDNRAILDGYDYAEGIIESIADFEPLPTDHLLIAIGDPATKRRIAGILRSRGGAFVTLIHPTATVAKSAELGEGVILCPHSLVSADARAGQLVIVNAFSSLGHDVSVGDFSTLSAHVDLTGFSQLGEEVLVGSGARILPKVKVGDRATIGAGSTVYRSVDGGATVFSPPAKLMPH